jgi:Tol biopolymer transport system component/tRNA A-37 threonylcarbamoyl transferase component Bud32
VSLSAGTRLGPYEITGPLGAGGMGEVYRATDTKLKRQVAIKILPADLASDAGRLARFQREAEVLASLNHPHIAAVYGFEESSSVNALVMELVDGATLDDRIAQGPIAIEEALPIARQIADALEAAHERGIVHRDLKPANIKLRDDGTVKVLDFGLAKAMDNASGSGDLSKTIDAAMSPTMASPAMSMQGMILGTAAYMSPEQARGKPVDKRTDVWAFGAVLYEILAGKRAFEGDDITDIIANVVKSTPDWSAIPSSVPHHVVTLIQRCLDKDRKTRIGDIAVARFLLAQDASAIAADSTLRVVAGIDQRRWRALPWLAAALIAGVAAGWMIPRRSAPAATAGEVTHLQMDVRPATRITPSGISSTVRPSRTSLALSPDGRRIVFAGIADNVPRLYRRDLHRAEAVAMESTEGAVAPFYSPDGEWIGFVADGKLKKVAAAGGPAVALCDVRYQSFWGASWGENGVIYFGTREGILSVPAGGGTPVAVTQLNLSKGERHLSPQLLPGGKTLLITSPPNVSILPLDTKKEQPLFEGSDARYIDAGYVVYLNGGTLLAVPFDAAAARITGALTPVIENVMIGQNAGNSGDESLQGQFAVSKSGTLAYITGGPFTARATTLMWVDRKGVVTPLPGEPTRPFLFSRLSPDGQKIAVQIRNETNRGGDVWVYDIARQSPTRLTFDGAGAPVWSPDSKQLITSGVDGDLYTLNADGSGKPQLVLKSEFNQVAGSWAGGANRVAFLQRPTLDTYGLWVLPMQGADAYKPKLFWQSQFPVTYPELAPDGNWLAYASTESGGIEIYVQSVPAGQKLRISTNGGTEPIWVRSGREILYRTVNAKTQAVMSAAVRSLSPLRIDAPRVLFTFTPGTYDSTTPARSWDATADGSKFLVSKNAPTIETPVTSMHVVLNWIEELRQKVK